MAHTFTVSEYGLNLIKAYEGFKAVATTLVSGQKIIGYGHVPAKDESATINKNQAEALLLQDLAPFESLVNSHVFAPLTQNTFDALVSLSFNIGQEAFLGSDILQALNLGRPLKAAHGFDAWRKGRIGGKVYVVDALVRRRAAEKALFLSLHKGAVSASRHELPPIHDVEMMKHRREDDVFAHAAANITQDEVVNDTAGDGVVAHVPYIAHSNEQTPRRRAQDKTVGVLMLSERVPNLKLVEDTNVEEQVDNVGEVVSQKTEDDFSGESEPTVNNLDEKADDLYESQVSPIAAAAAEVSERLDNLMDDNARIDAVIDENRKDTLGIKAEANTENTAEETDILKRKNRHRAHIAEDKSAKEAGMAAYWSVLAVGLLLLLGAIWKLYFSRPASLDAISAFLAPVAILIGALCLIGGIYYLVKGQARHILT